MLDPYPYRNIRNPFLACWLSSRVDCPAGTTQALSQPTTVIRQTRARANPGAAAFSPETYKGPVRYTFGGYFSRVSLHHVKVVLGPLLPGSNVSDSPLKNTTLCLN